MFTDIEPGSDPRLAAVFSAARAPAELPLPGEQAALAAYRNVGGRSWFRARLRARPAQMIAAAIFGGVVVAGGVATAATGTLPIISVHHPRAAHAPATDATNDDATGQISADPESSDPEVQDSGGPGSPGHPAQLGSVQKGIDTCTKASKGKCHAGQHGKALAAHDHRATHSLPAAALQHRSGHANRSSGAAAHRNARSQLRAANRTSHRRG